MSLQDDVLAAFDDWYQQDAVKTSGEPVKGTVSGALIVLDRLKTNFDLNIDTHMAPKGTQVKGASGAAVGHILQHFGETRSFVKEGGRTNRGLKSDITKMLKVLDDTQLARMPAAVREEILESLQLFLVGKVGDYFNQQRLRFVYEPSQSVWQSIRNLLTQAESKNKAGQVAQYLVGAKLELRFPEETIRNESYSTADSQKGLPGDFLVSDTVFHITVAPMGPLYEKCKTNLQQGYRVCILVPYRLLGGTKQLADLTVEGRIAVNDVESFVAQNIEELSLYSSDRLPSGMYRLLETYNARVGEVETDKSVMIEIPANLRRFSQAGET